MIVRELVTLIGYRVDKKSEKKATGSVDGLKKAAAALSAIFATGVLAQGLKRIVGLGSDAAETMNVITASFGDQADAVVEWSKVQSKALGRSKFLLRDYAATLGAVLKPLTGNSDAAAEMSKGLAQLTVDLGSFFNAAESDVLLALRSGITGEAEPLKRFGIVMSVAALDAFALSQGLGKTTKAMSEAEKVALRYQFILARTTDAQGDAARTAGGYANLTKALEAVIVDLGTEVGMMLLPSAESLLKVLIDTVRLLQGPALSAFRSLGSAVGSTVRALDDMIQRITGVESGLIKFSAVALAVWAVATAPIIVTIALLGLLGLAVLAVVEDLEAMGAGGESVIGGLISEFNRWRDETGSIFSAIGQIIATAADFWAEKLLGIVGVADSIAAAFASARDNARSLLNVARQGAEIALEAGIPVLGALQARDRAATAGAIVINNATETIVNAAAGMDAGQLAEQTAARSGAAFDRIMRKTASQIGVGG